MKKLLLVVAIALSTQVSAQSWYQVKKAVASDRLDENTYFGGSVDISDKYAVSGAHRENWNELGLDSLVDAGAAYIFEKDNNGNWVEVQKIVASDRAAQNEFGCSVSISGDYIVVGSRGDKFDETGGGSMALAGSAYVFKRDVTGVWNEVQKIVPSDRSVLDAFGYSVSLDLDYLVVGADGDDTDLAGNNYLSTAGSVYVFEKNGSGVWIEVQKLTPLDRRAQDHFGVSLDVDSNNLIIGAYLQDFNVIGGDSVSGAGAAYVFTRNGSGVWNEETKLIAPYRYSNDYFGLTVAIDDSIAVVGSYGYDFDAAGQNSLSNSGAAYIFKYNSTWNFDQQLLSSNREAGGGFGKGVGVYGGKVVIGAPGENGANIGAAYLFNENLLGNWSIQQRLTPVNSPGGQMGDKVAVSDSTLLFGAFNTASDEFGNTPIPGAGAAFFFEMCVSSTMSNVAITACDSFTSPSGKYTWVNSAIYIDTIPNSIGCDSIITINLTINTVDTATSQNGNVLTANATNATYRWLDCNNGNAVITGETNQTFSATSNGSYAVEVTQNGCTDTSACFNVVITGLSENNFIHNLSVYPNPTNGNFSIDLGEAFTQTNIQILDLRGSVVFEKTVEHTQLVNLNFKASKGIYFVKINAGDKQTTIKLIKQ